MILIVASTKDPASMNISRKILENYKFKEISEKFQRNPVYVKSIAEQEVRLVFVNRELIYTQFITDFFTPKLLVFVSRHSSVSGIPTLSVHTPGNLAEAELGGIPRKVSVAAASAMKRALLELFKQKERLKLDYKVSYECTHHGPSLDVPTMFVELGSTLTQWEDLEAAEAVAHAAMAAVHRRTDFPAVLGIGGPHYNEKFTKLALNTKAAFGHIIPKYAVQKIDAGILRQCIQRTVERVESAVFDWKGVRGADKQRLTAILNRMNISVEKA
jgi:D-aminoacyl-tRNA deacylase